MCFPTEAGRRVAIGAKRLGSCAANHVGLIRCTGTPAGRFFIQMFLLNRSFCSAATQAPHPPAAECRPPRLIRKCFIVGRRRGLYWWLSTWWRHGWLYCWTRRRRVWSGGFRGRGKLTSIPYRLPLGFICKVRGVGAVMMFNVHILVNGQSGFSRGRKTIISVSVVFYVVVEGTNLIWIFAFFTANPTSVPLVICISE